MTARRALTAAALRGCVVGCEWLHVAEEIDGGWMAPFDADYLGAETRQDASRLRSHL